MTLRGVLQACILIALEVSPKYTQKLRSSQQSEDNYQPRSIALRELFCRHDIGS